MTKKGEEVHSYCEFGFEMDDDENKYEEEDESSEEDVEKVEVRRKHADHEEEIYSTSHSDFDFTPSWPKTYRKSMDMFVNVNSGYVEGTVEGTSLEGNSSTSSFFSRPFTAEFDATMTKPLIPTPTTTSDKEDVFDNTNKCIAQKFCHEASDGQQCSTVQAIFNGVNVLCGVGVLSTPYAVKEGGWSGLPLLFIFGVISCYTGLILMRCLDSAPGLQSYPGIAQLAYGTFCRLTTAILLYIELYAASVEYLILMADNLSSLFPNAQLNFYGIHLNSHNLFAILVTLMVLPTVWLRNLRLLSYLSVGGVVASILVVGCLLWVGVVDEVGFHPSGTALELRSMPIALGLYSACYTGHSVFPNIYTSMEKPGRFPIILIICFTTCCLLYTGVAICGYMMFGDSIQSQFTLNMPNKFVSTKIAILTTVINPLSKYALTIYPVALCLEELLPPAHRKSYFLSNIIRTVLVLSTYVVSVTVPFFGLLMALIGSFSTNLVALIIPSACYLKILGHVLGRLEILLNIVIIVIGVVCWCSGSYSAVMKIFEEMSR